MGASTSHQDGYQRAEPHWMHYGSINFDDEIPAEVLKVGASVGKKISPVRRFFALLATFDVCFCSFLWILSAMVSGARCSLWLHWDVCGVHRSSLFDQFSKQPLSPVFVFFTAAV